MRAAAIFRMSPPMSLTSIAKALLMVATEGATADTVVIVADAEDVLAVADADVVAAADEGAAVDVTAVATAVTAADGTKNLSPALHGFPRITKTNN